VVTNETMEIRISLGDVNNVYRPDVHNYDMVIMRTFEVMSDKFSVGLRRQSVNHNFFQIMVIMNNDDDDR
jgi:hypothetical protein